MQADVVTGTAPSEEVSFNRYPVTGDITHGHVSLSLEGATEVFGTLSGGVLQLDVPTRDGTLVAETFAPATPSAFNHVVQKLELRVYDDNRRR
jgi:hypothetical protein